MTNITFGMVGLGHIGSVYKRVIENNDKLSLKSVCDTNIELLKNYPDNVCKFFDFNDFLDKSDVDYIIIATPNSTHGKLAIQALTNEKNVIIEKPAAMSIDELDHIITLSKQYNKDIYFAFHSSFGLEVLWCLDYLKSNSNNYGPITSFFSQFNDNYILNGRLLSSSAMSLGDPWMDSAINAMSIIGRFIDPSSLKVGYKHSSYPGAIGLSANIFTLFQFEQILPQGSILCSGTVSTSWDQHNSDKYTQLIFGSTKTIILLNHALQQVVEINGNQEKLLYAGTGDRLINHYTGLFDDFLLNIQLQSSNTLFSRHIHSLIY